MNEDDQKIAIAKASDWKPNPFIRDMTGQVFPQSPPDYLKDLNAMYMVVSSHVEVEGFLFQEKYTQELRAVVTRRRGGCNKIQIDFWMAEATAAQRAEAFLRVINKWVE